MPTHPGETLPTDQEMLTARRLATTLASLIQAGQADILAGYILRLVGPDLHDPECPRFSSKTLLLILHYYPGGNEFFSDLNSVLGYERREVFQAFVDRLTAEKLDRTRLESLQRFEPRDFPEYSFKELDWGYLGQLASMIRELVDAELSNVQRMCETQATELAHAGYPVLAAMLATAAEVAIPASTLEVALNAIPFGRLAMAVRFVAVRTAARLVGRTAAKVGPAAVKLASETAAAQAAARTVTASPSALTRKIDDMVGLAARRVDKLEEVIQFVNKQMELFTPEVVQKFEALVARKVGTRAEALVARFKPPTGSTARVRFVELEDGHVVQEIRTSLKSKPRGKGREAKAWKTAEDCKLEATLSGARRHWGHLIAEQLFGDDACYNIVLMSERFNVSVYKTNADRILHHTPELAEKEVAVFIEFESLEAAEKRVASKIIWEVPEAGKMPPRFMMFGDPLGVPAYPFGQVMSGLDKFFRRLGRQLK